MTVAYSERLKDPRWQRKRLEALEMAGWACTTCGDKETTLHVHHKRYRKGHMPWDYELEELVVLCSLCHEIEHEAQDTLRYILAEAGGDATARMVGIAAGFFHAMQEIDVLVASVGMDQHPYYEIGLAAALINEVNGSTRRKQIQLLAAPFCAVSPVIQALLDSAHAEEKPA